MHALISWGFWLLYEWLGIVEAWGGACKDRSSELQGDGLLSWVQGTHPIRSISESFVAKVLMHASMFDAPLALLLYVGMFWAGMHDSGRVIEGSCTVSGLDAGTGASYVRHPVPCVLHQTVYACFSFEWFRLISRN